MLPENILLSVAALLALSTTTAVAELKYSNDTGGSVKLYGQFNPAYLSFDDGVASYGDLVDNEVSNSRVGIEVKQEFGSSVLIFDFLTGMGFGQSSNYSQTGDPDFFNWDRTFVRELQLSLKTENAGTFTFGQGSMTTDGVAQSDLSGTKVAMYNGLDTVAGNYEFRTAAGALSGVEIDDTFTSFDSSRRGRIRYDSPSLNNFTFSAAYGTNILTPNNDDIFADAAVRYKNEIAGTKIIGSLGFSRRTRNGVDRDDTFGSISGLHPSGFNLTLAAGSRKDSGSYSFAKVGYIADWLSVGKTSMAVDFYNGSDFVTDGSSSKSVGFGVVQKFDAANLETYLVVRSYEYADSTNSYLDASSVLFGSRWKF
ncbi:porin [Phaeobacter sp. 22II1-1F12B]|uniref:porin n=1 Tax=Phaeobacter sp. 22II1-1F12B TaxID=1317111 RepID=UPI000B52705B|nr:porin [Phaeobacter sp. 22II1-1F12B]OWU70479.1 hypothetical protein ATO1_23915 [Phaeobacter sp. 22II1-1F12B]